MPEEKPKPVIDDDHRAHWDALERNEFLLFRCMECGAWYWPVSFCRNHANKPLFGNLAWAKASGRGKVFAFNIHHRTFHRAFEAEVPYVIGLVELEEGPLFFTRIVGCPPGEVKVGMAVRVVFERVAPDVVLPYFSA